MSVKLKLITALFLVFGGIANTKASHLRGSFITYNQIQDSVFEVEVYIYRDCAEDSLNLNNWTATVRGVSGGSSQNIKLKYKSVIQQSKFCDTISNSCSPKNSKSKIGGVERFLFTAMLDFRSSPLKSLLAKGDIIIQIDYCCRSKGTSAASQTHRNYVQFNPLLINKSGPRPNPFQEFDFSCNEPVYTSFGQEDSEHDSLSYNFGCYQTSNPYASCPYPKGLSNKIPFTVYDPSGRMLVNPNANPPIGMYLDPETGFMVFTPTNCSESTIMVVETKEWRKDSSGKYVLIGMTRSDLEYRVSEFKNNNPPKVLGPYGYSVCEEDTLRFRIRTRDKIYIPPPSEPKLDPDTVQLAYSLNLPGAKLTLEDADSLHPSYLFEWAPKRGMHSDLPYTFSVRANDNHCPIASKTSWSFQILVREKAKFSTKIDHLACNSFEIETETIGKSGPYTVKRSLHNFSGELTNLEQGFFHSTKNPYSFSFRDSLTIPVKGIYIIRTEVSNKPNCSHIKFDTVTVGIDRSRLFNFSDTFSCENIPIKLLSNKQPPLTIKQIYWSFEGQLDSGKYITTKFNSDTAVVSCLGIDTAGCEIRDTFIHYLAKRPIVKISNDTGFCAQVNFLARAEYLNPKTFSEGRHYWDNSATDTLLITAPGKYIYKSSNLCGSRIDTLTISRLELPKSEIPSLLRICDKKQTIVRSPQSNNQTPQKTIWHNGNSGESIVIKNEGTYNYRIQNACGEIGGSYKVEFGDSIRLNWPDTIRACDALSHSLDVSHVRSTYRWEDGSANPKRIVKKPGVISVSINSQFCGSKSFESRFVLNSSPKPNLGPDRILCSGDELILKAGFIGDEYLWSDGKTNYQTTINRGAMYWVQITNACGVVRDSIVIIERNIPEFVFPNDSIYICRGDSFKVDLSGNNYDFKWSDGDTSKIKILRLPKKYEVNAFNECGSSTKAIHVFRLNEPNIDLGRDELLDLPFNRTLNAWSPMSNYVWSSGETTSKIVVSEWGEYSVIVSNPCGESRDTITFSNPLSFRQLASVGIEIYPNPSQGIFKLHSTILKNIKKRDVSIVDVLGRNVSFVLDQSMESYTIRTNATTGIYWIMIEVDGVRHAEQVIIQRD